jgi:hypothetical protein
VNLFNQVLNGDMPRKFAAILVFVLFDSKILAQSIEHLDDLGGLPFGQ